jgi:hypothetical protein
MWEISTLTPRFNIIAMLSVVALSALGSVFPVSNSWYNYEPCLPIATLYTAIVDRCSLTGVSEPEIEQTWTLSGGSSNDVFFTTNVTGGITNITHYTNIHLMTTNILTTNQFGPFEYSYTSPNESGTATGWPYVTHYCLDELDDTIDLLIPEFLAGSLQTNGLYSHYFATYPTNSHGIRYATLPDESKAGMFYRSGIGYATNLTTNAIGFVTGGDAWWTRQPPTIESWTLAEAHYTGAWVFVDVGDFDKRFYDDPSVECLYLPSGTNAVQAVSVTSTGLVLVISNQSTVVSSEVVSVSSGTNSMNGAWYSISNLTVSGGSPSTGDVVAIRWAGTFPMYGDYPYRLYADDLNERAQALRMLTTTEASVAWYLGTNNYQAPFADTNVYKYGKDSARADSSTWADVKTGAEGDFDLFNPGAPARRTSLSYAWRSTHPAHWRRGAEGASSIWKLGAHETETNFPRSVDFYVLHDQSGTNTFYEFDNGGDSRITTNILLQYGFLESSATNQEMDVYSTTNGTISTFPAWHSTTPTDPTNDGPNPYYERNWIRGYIINENIGIVNWTDLTLQPE